MCKKIPSNMPLIIATTAAVQYTREALWTPLSFLLVHLEECGINHGFWFFP